MQKWCLLILALVTLNSQAASPSNELRIATAANFYPTLKKIKTNYEALTNNKLIIIRGSTGKLYAQIMQGAPYDIFFSADSARADRLVKKGQTIDIEKQQPSFVYAVGRLVLWRPDADSSQQLRQQLIDNKFHKLAIANPKSAPYGKASIEALKAMELYEEVKHKLVFGENIAQAMQFVQSGAADIGLVAMSYAKHDLYWEIDNYLHQPINQKVVILKQSKQPQLAKAFLEYLQSEPIKKLIVADGYEN